MRAAPRATAVGAVALAATLVLANCAGGDGGGGGESKELRITWQAGEGPGITAVVEAFEEANPDISVNLTTAEGGAYQGMLRTELSSGTAADVVFAWSPSNAGGIRTLDAAGYLEDLSDEPWVSRYPASLAAGTQAEDGRTLLMAPLTMGFAAIYNQTELDALGIAAPETWDEMFAYCDAAAAEGRYGYSLGGAEQYGSHAISMAIAADLVYGDPATGETTFQFDEDIVSGDTTFPTNEGFVNAWNQYETMLASNCFQPNTTGANYDEAVRLVASGESLATVISTLRIGQMMRTNPDADFRIHQFDSDNNPLTNQEILSIQGGASIPKGGDNTELAKEFVRFLADNIDVYWSAHVGTAPTIPDAISVQDDPNVEFMMNTLAEGNNVPYLNTYWCPEAEAAMIAGNQGMVVGTHTPTMVLEAMQAAYDACR